MSAPDPLALDTRLGWPVDLRVLVDRYPRALWPDHPNLGATARFWIARHDMFRELGVSLRGATAALREGEMAAGTFKGWFAPRLRVFLGELEEHHRIEDHAYFPIFRAADARLVRGFDVLESDHEAIHHALEATAERARALLTASETDQDALRRAADAYADQADRLLGSLMRHLDDEEDLVVPMILDRGEEALGI